MQYSFNPLKLAPDQALKSNHKRASSWQLWGFDAEANVEKVVCTESVSRTRIDTCENTQANAI